MRTTSRFGKPPCTSRMSSLSRRTITSSRSCLPRTLTPRQKRCGSRSSSSAEKLLEWPLCGVAERNSRCSKRGPRSRTARVNLRVDGVATAARRRGVMRLVEDQEAPGKEVAKPVAERVGVRRVDQQAVRDEEAGVGPPRVHAEPALAAHARQVITVEDLEDETEPLLELVLPLQEHRRRSGHDDVFARLAQQQLAGDQPGLDGLAQADVVGDEQVHARQPQRLAQRLQLVGVDPDAGAERRLEEARVGRGDAVPAKGMEEGSRTGEGRRSPSTRGRPILLLRG